MDTRKGFSATVRIVRKLAGYRGERGREGEREERMREGGVREGGVREGREGQRE